jgi:mercuric ion transport protein
MNVNANEQTATEPGLIGRILMPLAAALALLSASCCVLPIALSIIGLGGSWLTMLGPFIAYRGFILLGVAIALVWAWYRVVRPKLYVTRRRPAIVWASLASIAFLVALSSPHWEASVQRFMWDLWRSTR